MSRTATEPPPTDQAQQDWYFLVATVLGFGTQVALVSASDERLFNAGLSGGEANRGPL